MEETEEVKTFGRLSLRVMGDSLLSGSSRIEPTARLSLLLGRGVTGLACPIFCVISCFHRSNVSPVQYGLKKLMKRSLGLAVSQSTEEAVGEKVAKTV